MAIFNYQWNSSFLAIPADTENVSLGAGRIRDTKNAINERMLINHVWGDPNGNDGKHSFLTFQNQTSPPSQDGAEQYDSFLFVGGNGTGASDYGTVLYFLDTNGNQVPIVQFGALAQSAAVIPSGTCMSFLQSAVPTGWTQNTLLNDAVIRLVNNTTGGTSGGSWTISGVTVGSYALQVGDLPPHDHGLVAGGGAVMFNGGGQDGKSTTGGNDGTMTSHAVYSVGSGNAHTHSFTNDATWRPAYINACVGTKN